MSPKPFDFIGFGAMDVTKPYEFIVFGGPGTITDSNSGSQLPMGRPGMPTSERSEENCCC